MDGPDKSDYAPTISQVAEAAGVSRSSVSRAFSKPHMLRDDTVQRIMSVAARLGYVPNHTARALSTGRNANVAVIVPDVANPFFPPLIKAAQSTAEQSGYCVFLGNSNECPAQEDKLLDRFVSQVEGVILVSSRLPEARIRHHAKRRPIVLVNRDVPGIPRILIDSGEGVRQAVEHLASLGHRHIVYVGGPLNSWSDIQRRKAVSKAGAAASLTISMLQAEIPDHEVGRRMAGDVVETGATAVIAFDDLLAQGVMAGLAQRAIGVPQELSVVGCDDVLAAATWPALTTVSNRSPDAGLAAFNLLLDHLNNGLDHLSNGRTGDVCTVLGTDLVVRNSTASPV